MGWKETRNSDGTARVEITSNSGSHKITHSTYNDKPSNGGGKAIVTSTDANGLKGHTTIHGNNHVNYKHPDGKK